jgi:processive 1,2-diacylglycerol beta-glucosyltransferase
MRARRIVLMYISEVSGHHAATIAIEKAIKAISASSEVLNINAFNYTNPISEKIVNRLYMGVIKRTPGLWDYLYDNPQVVKKLESIKEAIHKFNSPKLKRLFDKFKPDVVACTQAFPCGMVADYKKVFHSRLPLMAVLTDYIPHAYWIYDAVDYYIAPSEEVKARLLERGVSEDKVKVFGIPFDHDFNQRIDRRVVAAKLGLQPAVFTILIMGGGQGLGPIKTVVCSLDKLKIVFQGIIVTGTNKGLYRDLEPWVKKSRHRLLLYAYVQNIHALMSVADVIITKPGGITTAEAMAKNLPMIIVKPIPGQEMNNTFYLTKKGAAIKVDDPEEIASVIEGLYTSTARLGAMRRAALGIAKPQASRDIAELLLSEGTTY